MESFMYSVLETKLKTGKGKLLKKSYKITRGEHVIYKELTKHAMCPTA
jgi:hypothetical protein